MRGLVVAFLPGLALVASACGIPTDQTATLADPKDVPFNLLVPAESTNDTTDTTARVAGSGVTVYMIQGERLAPVERDIPAPGSPEATLEALARGPSRQEAALGLRSAVVGRDVVGAVTVQGGIATVDLGVGFKEIAGPDVIKALAQIVATLTGRPGVGQVRFTLEGVQAGVPRGDGSVTSDPVSFDDYSNFAPVPAG